MPFSVDILEALFGGPGRTAVLRLLVRQTSPLTGRQVAELSGLSVPGAARVLDHFAGLGIVARRRAGRAVLHELNRESLLVSSVVVPAVAAEQSLQADMESTLADAFGPVAVSVVLFGSAARGEADRRSDADVLVVTCDDAHAVRATDIADDVGPLFYRRYGLPLSVMVTTAESTAGSGAAYLRNARDEGVLIAGAPLADVMRRAGK
jgi:predicted nucleotidyltransferase